MLTLPVLRNVQFSWRTYYPKRLVRLYLLVLAAVVLGLLLVITAPRFNAVELGSWVNACPDGYTALGLIRDVTLITGVSTVVSPLWSLRWEVLFSLALPLYIYAVKTQRIREWVKISGVGLTLIAGSLLGNDYIFFLSIFLCGALMAGNWSSLSNWSVHFGKQRWLMSTTFSVGILMACCRWELQAMGVPAAIADRFSWLSVLGT